MPKHPGPDAAPAGRSRLPVTGEVTRDFAIRRPGPGSSSSPYAPVSMENLAHIPQLSTALADVTPLPPAAVLVPEGPLLGPPSAQGVRVVGQRTYLDLDTQETVLVVHDPVAGGYRERSPHALQASGPVLRAVPGTRTWTRSAVPASPANPRPASVSGGRLDPVWNLADYQVHGPAGHVAPAIPGMRSFATASGDYCFEHAGLPGTPVYAIDATGRRTRSGKIDSQGLIQISGETLQTCLLLNGRVCRVGIDTGRSRWKLCAVSGAGDVTIETGGRPGAWVPELRVERIGDIIHDARRAQGLPTGSSPSPLGSTSPEDLRVYRYLRHYARQIIGFTTPAIRHGSAQDQHSLIDAHIWQHGYPYDQLRAGVAAQANLQALPVGLPQFDAFQGMAVVSCTREGGFNINTVAGDDQLYYPLRLRTPAQDALLTQWRALSIHDTRARGAANEAMYRLCLEQEGYRIVPGGTYGGGQNGFDLVFRGPAQEVYLLEVKHASAATRGGFSNVSMARVNPDFQMEDGWVRRVLNTDAGRSEAGVAVRLALQQQRLFKVVGVTTPDGRLWMFRIDMRPVRA
ncbi:MAG: hypothetical protein GAK37_02403 [Pseudomonas sp.]|nr:MAG: hypothetical protein GAK37_02403 [Pseudomonas sp.]